MWHVTVENKDMVGGKTSPVTSLHGAHRVCLTHDQMVFVPATNTGSRDYSRGEPIEIPITKIRVCGHKEGMFFIQPGRSSGIGHGNLWLDLGDEVMAANMHQTILKVMYTLNQDETNKIRERSYSSGSNANRARSLRTHHNNPPPSQIGMGKAPNNRIRCDSLPVTNLGGGNDSRLRTGSEGEHTMKKPPRICNFRTSSGPASPGMRSRKLVHHSKRGYHQPTQHLHNVSHTHSASLSGSCNGSSPTSSTECLSISSNTTESLALSSSAYYSTGSRPTPPLSNASDGTLAANPANKETVLSDLAELQGFPPQDVTGSYERHYCTSCFAHIPYFDSRNETVYAFFSAELAPSPPDIAPPHPVIAASPTNGPEYVNISVHSRTQSADEYMSTDTAFSSLSASPQASNLSNHQTKRSSSEIYALKNNSGEADISLDEYTSMDTSNSAGRYPHQKKFGSVQKPNPSLISRIASITGVSSESRKKSIAVETDYTPMIPTTTPSSKTLIAPVHDYVPMRSFVAKRSNPQDIRRRSIPDSYPRHSAGSSRSSPPYDFSPGEKFYESGSIMQNLCYECQRNQKMLKNDDYAEVIPGSARSDSGFSLHPKTDSLDKPQSSDPPQLHVTHPEDSKPCAEKTTESISLQSLQNEVPQINNYSMNDANSSSFSSSPVDAVEINGYLPMNPLSGQSNRSKTVMSDILSVAENQSTSNAALSPPQYPHQKRSESNTNSLDRRKKSPRIKRLQLSSRTFSNGSTRRSQSLRQPRSSNDVTPEGPRSTFAPLITRAKASSLTPPPSPAGEYVNIDYAKAQEQLKLNSPHLVHSDSEGADATSTQINDDSEYTEMNYNAISHQLPESLT